MFTLNKNASRGTLLLFMAVLLSGLLMACADRTYDMPDDQALAANIYDSLQPNGRIAVESTNNGIVTLKGRVTTVARKTAALEIARNTPGVRQVIDQIEVVTPRRYGQPGAVMTDESITARILSDFMSQPALDAKDIRVSTYLGEVTLTGAVAHQRQVTLAENMAKRVEGVRGVNNLLKVRPQ